ncbi:MAG TPA: PASTA domain-containing protein [Acidisarcina sp.]|nr:PASTA domain-containing protein [Acidisarcina sp.]
MIRFFQFAVAVLLLALVTLLAAITTMHFAIHGAEVTVPDFRGMTVTEATHKAILLGVNLSVDNRFYSAEVPADRVLSQSPAPGTVVRREWHVRITQSLGPQKVSIPNVVGQEERMATIQIRRLGLDLGTVAHLPMDSAAPGTVIAQTPPPDAAGVERPTVSLLIAEPPSAPAAGFVMPDLTGQTAAAASYAVTHVGLKLSAWKDIQVPIEPPSQNSGQPIKPVVAPGTVVAQSPAPGFRVDPTMGVELTIAR